jgi:hypothetical protein
MINEDLGDYGFSSFSSTLLMTDPSITLANGSQYKFDQALKQREKWCEIAFEVLGVERFALIPAQVP